MLNLLVAVTIQYHISATLYYEARTEYCTTYVAETRFEYATYILCFIFLSIFILQELLLMVLYRSKYFSDWEKIVKLLIIFSTVLILFISNKTLYLIGVCMIWLNVILSLRNARVYGKYVLMVISITRTFCKLALMFFILLCTFTFISFFLYYESDAIKALNATISSNAELQEACWANASYSADSFSDKHLLDELFQSNYEVQYGGMFNLK